MISPFIKEHIEKFVNDRLEILELVEIVEAIYDEYALYDQIGYGVVYAISLYKSQNERETEQMVGRLKKLLHD